MEPELDATSTADVIVEHESDQLVLNGLPSPTVTDGIARSSMPVEDGDTRWLVHRYEGRDGLPGEEGAFLLCSFWLVDALALSGRTDEAIEIFEDVIEYATPLGLFSEEVEPSTDAHLGNTPQAFSRISLINSVLYLESVLSEEPPEPLPREAEASNEIESGDASDR